MAYVNRLTDLIIYLLKKTAKIYIAGDVTDLVLAFSSITVDKSSQECR